MYGEVPVHDTTPYQITPPVFGSLPFIVGVLEAWLGAEFLRLFMVLAGPIHQLPKPINPLKQTN